MNIPKVVNLTTADPALPEPLPEEPSAAQNHAVPFGPERPAELGNVGYQGFSQKRYLEGHAHKILYDLTRTARLYNGHHTRFFVVDNRERCPKCTNQATGERLLTKCSLCHGTGYVKNWKKIGDFWVLMDFGPAYQIATPYGNTENPSGTKTQMMVLGAPILPDQTIAVFKETKEAWKLYDTLPHLIAMRGEVLIQIAQVTRLTPGSEEYKVIDW